MQYYINDIYLVIFWHTISINQFNMDYRFLFLILTGLLINNGVYAVKVDTPKLAVTSDSTVNKTDSTAWNVDLAETTVTSEYIVKGKDKLLIYPTKDMKNNAFDGYTILSMLMIPGLDIDEFDKTITTRNQSTTVCINGRSVEKDEIQTLNPKDIKRIDYYQYHDPRFPMATSVIDFIMKSRDHGGQIYLSAKENLNMVAGKDVVDIKHYFKKAEMNLQVTEDYVHFTQNRGVEQITNMQFPDQNIVKDEINKPSPQHKNNVNAKLSFLRRYGKRDMLQLAAYVKNGHNKDGNNLTETFSNGENSGIAYDNRHTDNTATSFKGFFQKTFNDTWQIRAWLNGRYNHTDVGRSKYSIKQINSTNKEDYYSFSPSFGWLRVKKGKFFNPFFSIDYYYDKADGTYIENGLEDPSLLINQKGAISIGNNFQIGNNVHICIQPDIQWLRTNNDGVKETQWTFSPKLWANVVVSKKDFIFIYGGITQKAPEVKFYNDTEHTIDPYQKYRGNPDLKSGINHSIYVDYNHTEKWGMFRIYTNVNYKTKNIYQSVEYDENRYLFMRNYLNGSAYTLFNISPEIQIKLIENKLRLKTSVKYQREEERNHPDLTINSVRFSGELQYINKAFSSKLTFKTKEKDLSGGYEVTKPVSLRFSMGYTYKGCRFEFQASNPFMKSYVKTDFVADKYSIEKRSYSPKISYNMFNFSVAYRISYGKKHKFSNVDIDTTEGSAILNQ